MSGGKTPVLLDTDAYSVAYVHPPGTDPRVFEVRSKLHQAVPFISFQTRAELIAGAKEANWGIRRLNALRLQVAQTPTIHETGSVIEAFAELHALARRNGHALHDKKHTGDLWVAASAAARDLPLLSLDGIYYGHPGITLCEF